jgi:hypothetical protein
MSNIGVLIDQKRTRQCKHPHAEYTPLAFLHCYRCGVVLVNGELHYVDIKTEEDDNEDGIIRCSSYMTA